MKLRTDSERVCKPSVRFEEFRLPLSLLRARSYSLADDSVEQGANSLVADETVRLREWHVHARGSRVRRDVSPPRVCSGFLGEHPTAQRTNSLISNEAVRLTYTGLPARMAFVERTLRNIGPG